MIFTLKAGTPLRLGETPIALAGDADFDFNVPSLDALAETLAHDSAVFAAHRSELAHEEEVEREGETVTVLVTYGPFGVRQEEDKPEKKKKKK